MYDEKTLNHIAISNTENCDNEGVVDKKTHNAHSTKIAFFNQSSIHYRKSIYQLMDRDLCVDFYFGDSRPGGILPMDESLLIHNQKHLHNIFKGPFIWQKGALALLKKDYTDYITPGETFCLSTWLFMILAKLKGKNVYLWTHGAYGNERGFKKWLTKERIRLCTGALLYGNYAKNILENYGCKKSKLHVIYNSLAYDEQLAIRDKMISQIYQNHFQNNNKNIVYIGRLTEIKKIDILIDAIAILKSNGLLVNFTIIGKGPVQDKLQTKVQEYYLEKQIWFYGPCYDESKNAELIQNADLTVVPGDIGLTAMHSMMFGIPVITHDNFTTHGPEFEAIEDGKTGTFFKENDVDSLAQAIEHWFNMDVDREEVRKACYKVIDEKYNPHVQIETMKRVLLSE